MTKDQENRAIYILRSIEDDGCSFHMSRKFAGGECRDENGRGFDCTPCAARKLLKELKKS